LEKKGIATVTIVTSAFLEMINKSIKEQGVSEMALVIVDHPIAGHNLEGIRKKVDAAFLDILRVATKWRPEAK